MVVNLIVSVLMLFVLILFTILLLHIGRHSKSNVYLAIYFISQIVGVLNYSFSFGIDVLFWIGQAICFSWGALFYFFISSLLNPTFTFNRKSLFHFISSIVAFLFLFLIHNKYFNQLAYIQNSWFQHHATSILNILFNLLIIGYNVAVIYKYYIYSVELKKHSALKKNIPTKWLQISLFGFAICCSIVQIGKIPAVQSINWFLINNIVFLLYFSVLFYISIVGHTLISSYGNQEKYKHSPILPHEAEQLLKKLQYEMEINQIFTNPEMNLKSMAAVLNTSERVLSQVINEHLQQNFSEYINTYRIKYAMELLSNPKNKEMTMLSVLFDSGFSSKTTFNITFKKIVGCTPIEYKRNK